MWPFTVRREASDAAHLELVAQIHGLVLRLKAVEEDLAALNLAHERLRGRFYATRTPESAPSTKTKAEILRDYLANRQKGS